MITRHIQGAAVPGKLKILLDAQKTKDFDVKSPALKGLLACAPLTGDAAGMLHHPQAGWLRQIDAGQLFPRAEWEVYACMALGLPAPPSARLAGTTKCRCGSAYDAAGHHAMTCRSHSKSAWGKGHESVLQLWAELARRGGVSTETRQHLLPRPVHTLDDQRADIKFRMSGRTAAGVVGDVSQTHGFVGKGRNAGEWGKPCPRRIEERAGEKNRTYGPFHQDQNMEFVPLIGDTRGNLCITSVAMFHILAHKAAEVAFAAREQTIMAGRSFTKAFCQQRSRYSNMFGGRLAMAFCRAGGARGLPANGPHFWDTERLDDALFAWD